jgi:hypothetical protein
VRSFPWTGKNLRHRSKRENGKFPGKNGKFTGRMESLQGEWKVYRENGKFTGRMESLQGEWKLSILDYLLIL